MSAGTPASDPSAAPPAVDPRPGPLLRVRGHLSLPRVQAVFGEDDREYRSDDVEVPPQGLDNLVLRIGELVSRG